MAALRLSPALVALGMVTVVLLAARLTAAGIVGFGDSEALYASYALHPAPAYLDHPGLVGLFAAALGSGGAPSPASAHVVTSIVGAGVPWLVVAAARAAGAEARAACVAGLAVAVAPEIAVGLFAMTPDLLLAPLWIGALGLACGALRRPSSTWAASMFVGAGLLAGIAISAKVSGIFLFAALAFTYLARREARSPWPWIGLALGAIVVLPIVLFEAKTGWPMLRHRLVETQGGAGPSLRNAGLLVAGQLAYVSPVLAYFAARVAVDLFRRRGDDAVASLLFAAVAVPLVPLAALCLWSRVAEPHWIAPALLALPIHYARGGVVLSRRLAWPGLALAGLMSAAVYAWILAPGLARHAPGTVDPKLDITSELTGWPDAISAVAELARDEHDVVVVGPHWTLCAQLHAALGSEARVGCMTPIRDDFDVWLPRPTWQRAEKIIYVTDGRFPTEAAALFPDRIVAARSRVTVLRGGKISRVFVVAILEARARASR